MAGKQVWVSPSDKSWKVQSSNTERAAAIVDTKAEAVELARKIAINKEAELIVQNLNGEIAWRNSYGKDPFPPKG